MTETSRVHVCSLSTSALPRIQASIDDVDATEIDKHRLMWLKVAMTINRQTQLQSLYSHLGSKGKDPKFRQIRMSAFWNQWKRQSIRADWNQLLLDINHKNALDQVHLNKLTMDRQRSEIAARNFVKALDTTPIDNPLSYLFTKEKVSYLYSYENPVSCRPGFYNRGIDFLASSAIRTLSEAPVTDDESVRK